MSKFAPPPFLNQTQPTKPLILNIYFIWNKEVIFLKKNHS